MSTKKSRLASALIKLSITFFVIFLAWMVWLDSWVMQKFNGQKWAMPATVYARPLELYRGLAISQQAIIKELRAAAYQQNDSGIAGSFYSLPQQLHIALRHFDFWDGRQEATSILLRFENDRIVQLNHGLNNSASIRLEPISIGKIHTGIQEDRLLVTLDEVPPSLIFALLATEDRDFFEHYGISFKSIARAALANIRQGKISQGGSTLTQQLVKNFFLDDSRSFSRKIHEALIALLLELHADKNEILTAYINEVYVAQDGARAIHGFGLASQYLFNKPLADVDLAEAALLVGMMKGPSYYNPLRHKQRAIQRRNLVLDLMAQQEFITEAQARSAKQQNIQVSQQQLAGSSYPAYLDLVRRQLLRDYSEQQLTHAGLRIFSNMNPQWQWHSQAMLQAGIRQLKNRYNTLPVIDGGVVVIDYATGDVLAIIAGQHPRIAGFNRALDAQRPIGSLVKPAVYLTALEQGFTLSSVLNDSPVSIPTTQGDWQPQNFDKVFHGEVPLIEAIAKSYNAATVHLGMQVGINAIIKNLQQLGIEKTIKPLPSVLLGSIDLSPLDVAQMYSTIAANGFYTPLKSIREVSDSQGNKLQRYPLHLQQRIAANEQYLLDFALQNVMHEGTGKSVRQQFPNNTIIAGKTGTSNDQRDSWFAGYDRNRLAVVWLGNDNNQQLPFTGATGALPIWASIMQANRSAQGSRIAPSGIDFVWVDKTSGKLSAERCENAVSLPFVNGSEPKERAPCTISKNPIKSWFKKWFSNSDS